MEKKIVIVILGGLLIGSACSHDSLEPVLEKEVSLKGTIGLSTRAVIDDGYENELEVGFCRQDVTGTLSEDTGGWSRWEAVRAGGAGSRPILFTVPQLYPEDGSRLRMRGYYPRNGEVTDGAVMFVVDGKKDIMATGLLEGCNREPMDLCTFSHLLTQLRFACYSDRAASWGIIRKIEVERVPVRWQLSLSGDATVLSAPEGNSETADLTVNGVVDLAMPEVATGGKKPVSQGYVLLPAGSGRTSYRISITTSRDGYGAVRETVHRANVSSEEDWFPGKIHRIELFFSENGLNAVSVGVSEWSETDGGNTHL